MSRKLRLKRAAARALEITGQAARLDRRGRRELRILTYHRVNEHADDFLAVHPDAFAQQMERLANERPLLGLAQAAEALARGESLPEGATCVTFDDGYADNHDVALPILTRFGIPATVFLVHDYLDSDRVFPWYDESEQRARGRHVMSSAQAENLKKSGVELGVHTRTHPILPEIPQGDAVAEIDESKSLLEARFGPRPVFAFPRGLRTDFSAPLCRAVRDAGFTAAVTTISGTNGKEADLHALRRSAVEREDESPDMFARVLRGTSDAILGALRDSAAGGRLRASAQALR